MLITLHVFIQVMYAVGDELIKPLALNLEGCKFYAQ